MAKVTQLISGSWNLNPGVGSTAPVLILVVNMLSAPGSPFKRNPMPSDCTMNIVS